MAPQQPSANQHQGCSDDEGAKHHRQASTEGQRICARWLSDHAVRSGLCIGDQAPKPNSPAHRQISAGWRKAVGALDPESLNDHRH